MGEENNLTKVVIPIILGLVITDTLQSTFRPVFEASGTLSLPPMARLFVFFLMTFRFYLGAIGYVNTQPKRLSAVIRALDFFFFFLTFCVFYMISLSVSHPEYFFLLMVILHAVDAVWFAIALVLSWNATNEELASDDLSTGATFSLTKFFFFLDVVTLGVAFFTYQIVYGADFSDTNATGAQWTFIAFLTVISLADFWMLKDFYFKFPEWRKSRSVGAAAKPT